eukprot:scaffold461_cov321-Pavlova_lutheri.AAC.50
MAPTARAQSLLARALVGRWRGTRRCGGRERKERKRGADGRVGTQNHAKIDDTTDAADEGPGVQALYHGVSKAMAGLVPLAWYLDKDGWTIKPVDLALGAAIPVHAHIGMNAVISDYVPPVARGVARGGMLGITAITALGLLKLNLTPGGGISKAVQTLWTRKRT